MNKKYIISVSLMTLLLPLSGWLMEHFWQNAPLTFALFGKWFIFFAVGLRLLVAGLQQAAKPAFTAKEIFHIESDDVLPIVRELGFANLCFGLVGLVSLWQPEWRTVSAFGSGLYYGLAGLLHLLKKPVSVNETFALWSDLFIFSVLLVYFIGIR